MSIGRLLKYGRWQSRSIAASICETDNKAGLFGSSEGCRADIVGVEALLLLYETSDDVWEAFPLGTGGDVAFEYSERFSPFANTRLPNWSTCTFSADF